MVLVPLVNCSHLPRIRSTGCSILDRSLSLLLSCQTKCIILEVQKLLRWRTLSPTADQTSSRLSRWRIVDNWFTCSRSKHRLVSLMKHICNICKINFGCITEEVKGIIAMMESKAVEINFKLYWNLSPRRFITPTPASTGDRMQLSSWKWCNCTTTPNGISWWILSSYVSNMNGSDWV